MESVASSTPCKLSHLARVLCRCLLNKYPSDVICPNTGKLVLLHKDVGKAAKFSAFATGVAYHAYGYSYILCGNGHGNGFVRVFRTVNQEFIGSVFVADTIYPMVLTQ